MGSWHVGIFVREQELMDITGVCTNLGWSIVAAVNGTFVLEQHIVSAVAADCGLKVEHPDMSRSYRGEWKHCGKKLDENASIERSHNYSINL